MNDFGSVGHAACQTLFLFFLSSYCSSFIPLLFRSSFDPLVNIHNTLKLKKGERELIVDLGK